MGEGVQIRCIMGDVQVANAVKIGGCEEGLGMELMDFEKAPVSKLCKISSIPPKYGED